MQLEGIAVLCAVEEEGTIRAAARSLGLSRTTAWRRLRELEGSLDCPLVERTQRSLRLTSAGRETVLRGRALLSEAESLRDAARSRHRGDQGLLRVAAPRNLSTTLRHSAARFTEPRFRSRPTSSRAG